jgi:hypothetical protein
MDGAFIMHGRDEKSKILVGKPGGKKWLGGPWYRWDDNIKMYLKNKV